LAWRCEELLRSGIVANHAELAHLGHVSRARISQILNLRFLAPDLQEHILFLPLTVHGRDAITVRHLQRVVASLDWREQRRRWRLLLQHLEDVGCRKTSTKPAHWP
jgi:hypothetical protein